MKYALEVRVESTMKIPPNVRIAGDDFTVEFLPDGDGILSSVRISAPLPPNAVPPRVVTDLARNHITVLLRTPKALKERMLVELKQLESSLGFCCPVQRLRWHGPKEEYIPETPEEWQAHTAFMSSMQFSHHSDAGPKIQDFSQEGFLNAMKIQQFSSDLVVPLSFWREGNNALNTYRNIQAFFYFYFVLEGMYGGGEYRREKILPKFLASPVLSSAVTIVINRGFDKPFRQDHPSIEDTLKSHNRSANLKDLLELLILFRGQLHHWLDAKSATGTPLTDNNYEAIASLASRISFEALRQEIEVRVKAGQEKLRASS